MTNVPKNEIVAFTFTESAAEELKFRIRTLLGGASPRPGEDSRLGGMYIGTIHGFCLKVLRDLASDEFYMFDVVDEAGRMSLIEQGYFNVLGLREFQTAVSSRAGTNFGKFRSLDLFLRGYDLLNEYDLLDVSLPDDPAPDRRLSGSRLVQPGEPEYRCRRLRGGPETFAESAARYYAYLRARRFLDFSTVQSEVTRRLRNDRSFKKQVRKSWRRFVVDEVQDVNPVQDALIRGIVGKKGYLTAVGDHRQAIYAFRGGRVDLMGRLYGELESSGDGHVQELPANYRSTPRIIDLANKWSDTIGDTSGMANPAMRHRRETRTDVSDRHVAQIHFDSREDEAAWIGDTIAELVRTDGKTANRCAFHDDRGGEGRGD